MLECILNNEYDEKGVNMVLFRWRDNMGILRGNLNYFELYFFIIRLLIFLRKWSNCKE